MSRPVCPLHPRARVKRNGYYGKDKQYVLWRFAGGGGDRPHQIRPELSSRLVGGAHGHCEECQRPWEATDGMPQATGDRFILAEKARALVSMGQGASYRSAALGARRQARHQDSNRWHSGDWRMGGDWVAQYAPIVAEPHLPTRWPTAIAVDELDVRVKLKRADGSAVQRGAHRYSILAVVGYEPGRPGRLWRLHAAPDGGVGDWKNLFSLLDGQPEIVVFDQALAASAAVAQMWPDTRRYLCCWHLYNNALKHLKRAKLATNNHDVFRALDEFTFMDPWAMVCFRRALQGARRARPRDEHLERLERTLNYNRDDIWRAVAEPHHPRTIAGVEEVLDAVRKRIGDRARNFKNLPRLNCLLALIQLDLLGVANDKHYARLLRENHLAYNGTPPPRRTLDRAPASEVFTHAPVGNGQASPPAPTQPNPVAVPVVGAGQPS
jgi:hypothetical protein